MVLTYLTNHIYWHVTFDSPNRNIMVWRTISRAIPEFLRSQSIFTDIKQPQVSPKGLNLHKKIQIINVETEESLKTEKGNSQNELSNRQNRDISNPGLCNFTKSRQSSKDSRWPGLVSITCKCVTYFLTTTMVSQWPLGAGRTCPLLDQTEPSFGTHGYKGCF